MGQLNVLTVQWINWPIIPNTQYLNNNPATIKIRHVGHIQWRSVNESHLTTVSKVVKFCGAVMFCDVFVMW